MARLFSGARLYLPTLEDLRAQRTGLLLTAVLVAAPTHSPAIGPADTVKDAPVPVRFPEGSVHGFLRLSSEGGKPLADGGLLQTVKDSIIESRMVFAFADSSFFEETVAFTQRTSFRMVRYRLIQRGPAFERDLDATLERSGAWIVKTTSHKDGKRSTDSGKLDLPPDTYNGMPILLAKNLAPGVPRTVHLVAFTPKPRLIGLEMTAVAAPATRIGRKAEPTVRFTFKPKLGALLGFFARLFGKLPPDSHAWFVTEDVPAFVRFEGPLYTGPVWRIDLVGPTLVTVADSLRRNGI